MIKLYRYKTILSNIIDILLMRLSLLALAIILYTVASITKPAPSQKPVNFCWKSHYSRGIGNVANQCGDKEHIGLNCYERCPAGYKRVSVDCHQVCPPGFIQKGNYCALEEYNRGPGYKWKGGDGEGMFRRLAKCESIHGRGSCEIYQYVAYPKCKPGYTLRGCCTCVPDVPQCVKLGLFGTIDTSCIKKIIAGKPEPADCPLGTENHAGICYGPCKQNFQGFGPICWSKTSNGKVTCGMGEAQSYKLCAETKIGAITTIGKLAYSIARQGSSFKTSAKYNEVQELKQRFYFLTKTIENNKKEISKIVEVAKIALESKDKMTQEMQSSVQSASSIAELKSFNIAKTTVAQIVNLASKIAALASPTNIAAPWEKNIYPKCSTLVAK